MYFLGFLAMTNLSYGVNLRCVHANTATLTDYGNEDVRREARRVGKFVRSEFRTAPRFGVIVRRLF